MESLSAARLLEVWERGRLLSGNRRALLLLEEAWSDESPTGLARLPVGRRDARLLTLRTRLFGSTLHSVSSCPECGEALEWSQSADELRATGADDPVETGEAGLVVEEADYSVRFRLPTTEDLLAVGQGGGGARALLERCVEEARQVGRTLAVDDLPEDVVAAIGREMERADPQAQVTLRLECPSCGHRFENVFDIVSYLWAEIDRWARRLLDDVHLLASRYGWSEAEILAMSAWRRDAYLTRIRG